MSTKIESIAVMVLLVFIGLLIGVLIGFIIGWWAENQVWLAHCSQTVMGELCGHP
jgi:membrane protein DedA with SNARE-associated domain